MDTLNKYETGKEALKIGSKILNMNEDLLDTFEKEPHIRKKIYKCNTKSTR